jgi:hypothetical protein
MIDYEKVGQWIVLSVIGFIVFCCVLGALLPDNKPNKSNTDYMAEKLAHGGELNWLDKQSLKGGTKQDK